MARFDYFLTDREKEARNRTFDTSKIYMAEVMDTRNVTQAGEIKVWVLNSNVDKNDSSKWVTCSYCSPFYGTTPYFSSGINDFKNSPKSFGAWFPIPCVGNFVFIFYACIYGENILPYWFGCPVDSDMNYMIPGIPKSYYNDRGALCELNVKNSDINEITNDRTKTLYQKEQQQAEYTPLNNALIRQGLEKDKLRGYSTSGSKRESPSMCYGILTPMGNSFVMDDGWESNDNKQHWGMDDEDKNSQLMIDKNGQTIYQYDNTNRKDAGFRLRTRNGTQLLISDNGNIYMINRDGSAWAEITDDGRLQGYAKTSVDIACDGDINFKSKRKVIMEADEGFAFKSRNGGLSMELAGDVNLSAPYLQTSAIINAPEINTKLGNIESFQSKMVQAKGVFEGTLQGTAFYATNAGVIPVTQPAPNVTEVELPKLILEEDKIISGCNGETQKLINTFAPTHEPYDGHNKNNLFSKLDVTKIPHNDETIYFHNTLVTNQINQTPIYYNNDNKNSCLIEERQLSEHYTLRDLCSSITADRLGINNNPNNEEIIEKLRQICDNILEPITQHYGVKAIINSGYRGLALNQAIGGASTSQHTKGEAVDIEVAGVNTYELANWIKDNLEYDQLILEYADELLKDPYSGWVHCSFTNENRKQVLTINRRGTTFGLHK